MHSYTIIGSVVATLSIVYAAPAGLPTTSLSAPTSLQSTISNYLLDLVPVPNHLQDIEPGPGLPGLQRRKTATTLAMDAGKKATGKAIGGFIKDKFNDIKCDVKPNPDKCRADATKDPDSKHDKRLHISEGFGHGPVVNTLTPTLINDLGGSTQDQAAVAEPTLHSRALGKAVGTFIKDTTKEAAISAGTGIAIDEAGSVLQSTTEKRNPKLFGSSGSSSSAGSTSGTASTTTGSSFGKDVAQKAGVSALGGIIGTGVQEGFESLLPSDTPRIKRSPKSRIGTTGSPSSSPGSSSGTSDTTSFGSKIATDVLGGLAGSGVQIGVEGAVDSATAPETTAAVAAQRRSVQGTVIKSADGVVLTAGSFLLSTSS